VDWEEIYKKEVPAPWTPYLKSEEDSSCFEKYPDSKQSAKALQQEFQHFFVDF